MKFEEWLKTDSGKNCNNYSTLNAANFLRNRLWWAFDAVKGMA